MMILSIILFFALTIGLGFLIDLIVKDWSADFLEKLVIRIGAGALFIPILGVVFNHLRIPIYWIVFLVVALSITFLAFYFRKEILLNDFKKFKRGFGSFKIKKSQIYVFFILVLFAISAYMYISGSFTYPWFENGDPYGYALVSKYVAVEKTYEVPYYFMHFAYPYTQGYQIFMGVMHQTNDSIYWTLKFFNAMIVSLSILFFFYFAKKFTKKTSFAFWATFTLVAIPAWVSHFVFSLNFNMALMLLLFYALFSINENKNWKYLGGLFYGAIIITHFYTSVVITALLLLVYFLRVLVYRNFSKDYLDVFLIGMVAGLVFWVPGLAKHWSILEGGSQLGGMNVFLPLMQKIAASTTLKILLFLAVLLLILLYWKNGLWFKHVKDFLQKRNVSSRIYLAFLAIILLVLIIPSEKIIYAKGSGTRVYGISDFFIAQKGNMINNPIGIGLIVMILFLVGLAILIINFKKLFNPENFYLLVALTWVIFSFIGIMGASLSIGFVPFRMWTFFGMAMSLITGYAIYMILLALGKWVDKKSYVPLIKLAFIALLLTSVYYTSFSQKYWHNTAPWPEHQILVPESQQLYIWMREGGLPKDSMVLPLCNRPSLVLGYDMLTKPWLNEEMGEENDEAYYLTSLNKSLEDNYNFLMENDYDYVIFGASCIAKFKANSNLLNNRLQEMLNSTNFRITYNTQSEFLFKVN